MINIFMQTYDSITKDGLLIHLSMTETNDVCYIFVLDLYTLKFDMKFFTSMQTARAFIRSL
jgi:hypothetical protein